jgi:hypothetical protein
MRDYYIAYVSDRLEKTENRADREGAKGAEDPFAPFAPSLPNGYTEKLANMDPGIVPALYGPGNEIFEERVAIMMFDGGLGEAEAFQYLVSGLKENG